MKSESIKSLTEALVKAHLAFKPIKRTEKVDYATSVGHKKYNYAPLDEVIDATKQALSDNGLAITQVTYLQGGNTILETLLLHNSGEWLSSELYVGKQDQPPQAEGSALTYKRRYGMSAILCVASEEDDDAETTGEITKDIPTVKETRTVDKTSHYCPIHNVNFFKTRKGYAHKIAGTKEWCNEPETQPDALESVREPTKEESKGVAPVEGTQPLIDMVWLKGSLEKLNWNTVIKYLKDTYKVTGSKVTEIIPKLTNEQQQSFIEEVKSRLGML